MMSAVTVGDASVSLLWSVVSFVLGYLCALATCAVSNRRKRQS